jgi:hypothetical protein
MRNRRCVPSNVENRTAANGDKKRVAVNAMFINCRQDLLKILRAVLGYLAV